MGTSTFGLTDIEQQIAAALGDGVMLGGRIFRRQRALTFERNVYTAKAANETGLSKALSGFDPMHETVQPDVELLILDAFANGSMYRVLAGVLGEDAIEWSLPIATENARFFARLTEPDDQARLYEISSWVLLDFFINAGGSWRTFLKYLSLSQPESPASDDRADVAGADTPIDPLRVEFQPEEIGTSANGMSSSEPLHVGGASSPSSFFAPVSATG